MSYTQKNHAINKDKAILGAKISKMIENGRIEITTKEELEEFPIGSLISYMNNNNYFKIGGFLTKITDEYFIFITSDFKQKYRVRYQYINKMWIGDVFSVKNDLVSIVPTTKTKTNYPVKVNNIVVYYAPNNFGVSRFKHTAKYKSMIQWTEYFIN